LAAAHAGRPPRLLPCPFFTKMAFCSLAVGAFYAFPCNMRVAVSLMLQHAGH